MLVVCPSCAASYDLAHDAVGGGRTVRCARCRTVWRVELSQDAAPPETELPAPVEAACIGPVGEDEDVGWRPGTRLGSGGVFEDAEIAPPRAAPRWRGLLRRGWLPRPAALVLAAAFAIVGGAIAARETVVALAPQMARLYAGIGLPVNLRGLAFRGLETVELIETGTPVLVVSGEIENVRGRTADVPRLRFAVRGTGGRELYVWTTMPARSRLGPGETMPFRAQLASPPAEAREIAVRFLGRYDMSAVASKAESR